MNRLVFFIEKCLCLFCFSAHARAQNRLKRKLTWLKKPHVLVIDEVGYENYTADQANLLFQLVNSRYEYGSIMITTNKPFGKWSEIMSDDAIAPSTYYDFKAKQNDPSKRSAREQSDTLYQIEIQRVWDANFQVYGARKVWHQLRREGFTVARCIVERLMRSMGLQGVVRGKVKRTTFPSKENRDPFDLVQRNFTATRPNQLWVADFTYVATWAGLVFVAFIIVVFSRMIVGWRASTSMSA